VICCTVVFIGGVLTLVTTFNFTGKNATNVKAIAEKPAPVIQTIDAFGVIKAKECQNIIIDFPSYVEKVFIRDGQQVKKGDHLVKLNTFEYNEQIKIRTMELKNTANLCNQDLLRLTAREQLYKTGSISRYDLDEFKETVNTRKNTEIAIASDLQVLKEKLSRPYIKGNNIISNIKNGVVYELNCTVGDKLGLQSDQPVKILGILDLDTLIVVADVDEEFSKQIRLGAQASITLLADRASHYQGKIIRIADRAIIKNNETYIPIEISIDNVDQFIRPEMNVDIKLSCQP
jgi:multidrug resistance efflux pump